MSILNVNQIQPVGSGQTVTISAANITASSSTISASSFVGPLTGDATGLSGSPTLTGITSVSTTNLTVNGNAYPSAGPLSNRNLIINGGMLIDQRNSGSSTTPTVDGTYTFDRWKFRNASGTGRFSVQQSGTSPNSIDPSMLLTVTTTATAGASEFYAMEQRVEGYTLAPAALGSADSNTLTLSFWVRSSVTGTYCCAFRNSDASRCYVKEYTINSVNTWEFKTITITAKTDGTWNTTNGIGAYVDWCLGVGANFQGNEGWQSANRVATANQTNWIGNSGATFYLTTVQLELGSVNTPFERRPYGDELARCQRYYFRLYADSGRTFAVGYNQNTTNTRNIIHFPVTMRSAPTALEQIGTASNYRVLIGTTVIACSAVPTLNSTTTNTGEVQATVSSGLTAGQGNCLESNVNGTYLGFTAEL